MLPPSGDFPDGPTVLPRVTRPRPACPLVSASPLEGLLTRHFTGVRREAAARGSKTGRMNEGGIAQTEQRASHYTQPTRASNMGCNGEACGLPLHAPSITPPLATPARVTEADFGQLCWLGTAEREVPPR